MPEPDSLHGRVVEVKDGDTCVVSTPNARLTVRLWGVDAPESEQPYGPYATEAAQRVVRGEACRVVVKDSDRYGRIVGRVVTTEDEELDLGRCLARSGYAWYSRRYDTSDILEECERRAREEEAGLWRQADPTPPWEWRSEEQPPSLLESAKKGWRWGRWIWRLLS